MPAFLHKKSLLDRFKDEYDVPNPIKAARSARSWDNPMVRKDREQGINKWAKSFTGKRHYRKLARMNALGEAYGSEDRLLDALEARYTQDEVDRICSGYPLADDLADGFGVPDILSRIDYWLKKDERHMIIKIHETSDEPPYALLDEAAEKAGQAVRSDAALLESALETALPGVVRFIRTAVLDSDDYDVEEDRYSYRFAARVPVKLYIALEIPREDYDMAEEILQDTLGEAGLVLKYESVDSEGWVHDDGALDVFRGTYNYEFYNEADI